VGVGAESAGGVGGGVAWATRTAPRTMAFSIGSRGSTKGYFVLA
jgi:hypothetical protein